MKFRVEIHEIERRKIEKKLTPKSMSLKDP